ncbi:hypothetical protein L208DRAFT_1377026 [Tricholoma matsutake]|nr:hypothetical protein L208DRAFT_1377026 [Tricholoma matsutake 945]
MSPRKPANVWNNGVNMILSMTSGVIRCLSFSFLILLSNLMFFSSSKHKELDDNGDSRIEFINVPSSLTKKKKTVSSPPAPGSPAYRLLPPVLILKVVQATLQAAAGGAASFNPDCISVASHSPEPAPPSPMAESIALISSQIPVTCLDACPERVKVKTEKAKYAKGNSTKEQPAASLYVTLPFVLS